MAPRKPVEELYDIQKDPYEIRNLADSPEHQKTIKKMRKILDKWIRDTGDKGQFPEPESAISPRDLDRIKEDRKKPE
jgi:hypothetical protein